MKRETERKEVQGMCLRTQELTYTLKLLRNKTHFMQVYYFVDKSLTINLSLILIPHE